MGIFDFFQKKTVGASDADAVDYSKLIEIARILSNDNKGLVDDATLMANDYEKFQQTYEKWCLEMWEDSLDNHNARLLTAAYWFVGYETSHQFGAYIDWKEETEDILWQLKSAIDSLGYSLNLDKIVFTGEEATDEALDKINAYFLMEGYTLVTLDTDSDCYHLFIIPNEKLDRLICLGQSIGFTFFYDYKE
ncbi:hypothetical protein PWEIH_04628 [Listeria weihenstephanensis FSL R9-0317]|uniref:DUF6630 domain-containing protein n=1 Tax=Listeria weihenstephanensis TaxID=1006155 RepID=A0A841ZBG2_9LIST|nr:hypothetical protein [Listeria weihenstephanensis]EUJ40191.1 hypothetical protein PWEIH_04628 [Listeria weihenstephanensis FSL R9-0317]MBC1501623.1 hypothetical protein [Listeria weihenstephanensis]